MEKYLTVNQEAEFEFFETIDEAREYLKTCFYDKDEGYHPDADSCAIYQLVEQVEINVVDRKENYKTDEESKAWPYSERFDEIWDVKFKPV